MPLASTSSARTTVNRSLRYISANSSSAFRSSADMPAAEAIGNEASPPRVSTCQSATGFQSRPDAMRYSVASAAGSLTVPSASGTGSSSTLGMMVLGWYADGSRSHV